MKTIMERLPCPVCSEMVVVTLVRKIGINGSSFPFWQCQQCSGNIRWQNKDWLPKSYILALGMVYDDLPIADQYLADPCVVCGEPSVELHHSAPRAIFGQLAEDYPQFYLCKKHHDLWHDTMKAYYEDGHHGDAN